MNYVIQREDRSVRIEEITRDGLIADAIYANAFSFFFSLIKAHRLGFVISSAGERRGGGGGEEGRGREKEWENALETNVIVG